MSLVKFVPDHQGIEGVYHPKLGLTVTTCEHKYYSQMVTSVVPSGACTDGASVPWLFRWLFPKVGPYSLAALHHDEMYRTQKCSRRTADSEFLFIMLETKTPKWQAYPMYWAVRIGGWVYWDARAAKKGK